MPMDPDSPFARLGDGSQNYKTLGYDHFGTMKCARGCLHEWNVPIVNGGARASACPRCHTTTGLVLMDGSVQQAPPRRP